MTAKEILSKAYSRMTDLYGNKDTRYWNHSPSVQIQNRFYYEKQFLESNELFLRYLELVGRMRAVARERRTSCSQRSCGYFIYRISSWGH